MEDHKNASEKAEAEKKQKDERLLAEANDIDLGFESEFNIFQTEITEAKNKKSVEQSLSKAEEYFKNKKDRLNEISKNISATSKKAPITKIIEHLNSEYNGYGFEALAIKRIAELKIKEEERKLWSTEGFNENFQRIWEEFKTVYEEKIQPDLIMNENSKKFIEQFKTLMIFFSTCDNHLLSIITKIESIPIKGSGTPHPFASTLIVFNKIKYIFGYSEPKSDAGMRGSYAGVHTIQEGNAFVLKFFEFFRKITIAKFENNKIILTVDLSRVEDIVRQQDIYLENLTTWLDNIYKKYIKPKKESEAVLQLLNSSIYEIIKGKGVIDNIKIDKIKKTIYEHLIKDDELKLLKHKFFLTSTKTIPQLSELSPEISKVFIDIFTIAPIPVEEIGKFIRDCKSTGFSVGGNKTKKLKRKQIFSKTHKNISSHNNGTANRFHRGQHRSRKNHHIHQITVRKY